jgi:hypothetical protein
MKRRGVMIEEHHLSSEEPLYFVIFVRSPKGEEETFYTVGEVARFLRATLAPERQNSIGVRSVFNAFDLAADHPDLCGFATNALVTVLQAEGLWAGK